MRALCIYLYIRKCKQKYAHRARARALSFAQVWPLLLARAAGDSSVPDSALLQMIKDAKDHVADMDFALSDIVENPKLLAALKSLCLPVRSFCSSCRARVACSRTRARTHVCVSRLEHPLPVLARAQE